MKFQQGDLIFCFENFIPEDGEKFNTGLIKQGISGNMHEIVSGDCELIKKNETIWFNAKTETIVIHHGPHSPHHGKIILPAGTQGRIIRIVETDPFSDIIKAVQD